MKIRIGSELFDYDRNHRPMAEMLELEKVLKCTYGEWEDGLGKGSARSLAGVVWLVWRRDGRQVDFADIESGAVEVNLTEISFEDDGAPPDPTTGPGDKEASRSTGRGTSGRSPKS